MTGWADLAAELDAWTESGRRASLWWRDDDAVAATPQLAELLRLADEVPLALAVIPAFAQPSLRDALADAPRAAVLQHGWQHVDRAAGGRRSEYPAGRAAAAVAAEIAAGRDRLAALFGARALPVFVPPWNRFAAEFLTVLPNHGLVAVSAMASRRAPAPPNGLPPCLTCLDADLDLIDWRGDRGFIGEEAALTALIGGLRARRWGCAAAARPLGLLTHHLIMDRATRTFIARLGAAIGGHRAGHWAAIGDLL